MRLNRALTTKTEELKHLNFVPKQAPSVGEKKTIDRVTYINQRDKEESLSH